MVDVAQRGAASPGASQGAAVPFSTIGRRLPVWSAYGLAFVASAATLVLELVAGRMLAPYVGVSLYTWTSIIGIVLAGISLGNWVGGRVADRDASPSMLGRIFLLGGLAVVASLPVVALFGDAAPIRALPLLARIFFLSALAFLPASVILAMATPVVIRTVLPDVGRAGRVVGLVYACATFGSLAGNFATGFVLTAYFDVTTIVLSIGAVLVVLAALVVLWGRSQVVAVGPNVAATTASARSDGRALRRPGGAFELAGNPLLAGAVVGIASFATMGIELSASRILAPYLGLSLYSWTGIIGVVLAAITVGNFLGGRIADRWPSQRALGISLFVAGMGGLAILALVELLDAHHLWSGMGLVERIVVETFVVFFVPVMLLGTISPQVTRLTITDLDHSGRIAGEVYAWSTAGAILGTFATGWGLIAALGVHGVVFALALVLVVLALAVGRFWVRPIALVPFVAIAGIAVAGLYERGALRSRCTLETNYFCIKVGDEVRSEGPVKTLVLDHLVHSYVKLDDPLYLGYVHEQVQAEITSYLALSRPDLKVLVIGGGGYTYPKWVEATQPAAHVEVVEIDPGVTEVAYDYLALPPETGIISHNLDGRQFVQELAPRGFYTLVVQDAVNDLSVPYHIMTREYNDQVRELLTPDGVYLLTVIDLFRDGQLLRSAIRTMRETFPNVQLLAAGPAWESGGASVWVIAGSANGIDVPQVRSTLAATRGGNPHITEMPPAEVDRYVAEGPQIVLTDEYAPVDNLIAILFRSRG